MKLKYEIKTTVMDDGIMAVPVDCEDFNGIIRINETTVEILELLKNDTTEEDIVCTLLKRYNAQRIIVEKSVKKVIKALSENNLLM